MSSRCGSPLPQTIVGRIDLPAGSTIEDAVFGPSGAEVLWLVGSDPSGAPIWHAVSLAGDLLWSVELDQWLGAATDVSVGPGPDGEGRYVFVADLAPDRIDGEVLPVLRFREPEEGRPPSEAEQVLLQLPPGAGRPGAMVVDREGGDIIVLASGFDGARVLRATSPSPAAEPLPMQVVAQLDRSAVRGLGDAAVDAAGVRYLVLGEREVSLWARPAGTPVESALAQPPCQMALPSSDESRSMTFSSTEGRLYGLGGTSHVLYDLALPGEIVVPQDDERLTVGNVAPDISILEPAPGSAWRLGAPIDVRAEVADDAPVAASLVTWELLAEVCAPDGSCETTRLANAAGTPATLLSDVPFGIPPPTRVELRASYADQSGLEGGASVDLVPETSTVTVDSDPPGATLLLNGEPVEAPVAATAVVGDTLELAAPWLQTIDGAAFEFDGWSNGDQTVQGFAVAAADETISLLLRPERGFVRFNGDPGSYADRQLTLSSGIGTIDLRAWVALDDWSPDSPQALMGANGSRLVLAVAPNGRLQARVLTTAPDPVLIRSTEPVPAVDGERLWVRYLYDFATGESRFFTSTDRENEARAVEWAQLGEPVVAETVAPFVGNLRSVIVGQSNPTTRWPMAGKVYAAMWLVDGDMRRRIDFSTTGQLTSSPPNYAVWGSWVLRGAGWEYVPSAQ